MVLVSVSSRPEYHATGVASRGDGEPTAHWSSVTRSSFRGHVLVGQRQPVLHDVVFLAVEERTTVQALLEEALDGLFASRGKATRIRGS